jgi:hypothetical protein
MAGRTGRIGWLEFAAEMIVVLANNGMIKQMS